MRKITLLSASTLLVLMAVAVTPASPNRVVAGFEAEAASCEGNPPSICVIHPVGSGSVGGGVVEHCYGGCNPCCDLASSCGQADMQVGDPSCYCTVGGRATSSC